MQSMVNGSLRLRRRRHTKSLQQQQQQQQVQHIFRKIKKSLEISCCIQCYLYVRNRFQTIAYFKTLKFQTMFNSYVI